MNAFSEIGEYMANGANFSELQTKNDAILYPNEGIKTTLPAGGELEVTKDVRVGIDIVRVGIDISENVLKEWEKQDAMYVNEDYPIPYENDSYLLRTDLTDIVEEIEYCREMDDVEAFQDAVERLDDITTAYEDSPQAFSEEVVDILRNRYGL